MRIGYYFGLGVLSLCAVSCVDKAYDMEALENVNTDINFGGEHFSMPIGSFEPILLGRFIQAGDLLQVSEGKYEFAYQSNQTSFIPAILPIDFSVEALPVAGIPVDLSGVSINDIDLPDITIDKVVGVASPSWVAGRAESIPVLVTDMTSPIKILYEYSDEIRQVNHILFGVRSATQGELLEVSIAPNYDGVLADGMTQIDNFSIKFPYGFELSADPNDPYHGQIVGGDTYRVDNQPLQVDKKMSFYVDKITFDPAIDQQVQGELRYNQNLTYSGTFTLSGTATGVRGTMEVALHEHETLTLHEGNFNTNLFTAEVPTQETPVGVDEAVDDPSIQNVRKVTLAQPSPIIIDLDVTGLPARVSELTLNDYTVHFPKFMEFADPAINASKSLVLNEAIPNGGRLNKRIYLTGFVFDENPIKEGRLVVSGVVTSSGAISLSPTTDLNSSDVENIVIKPNVTLGVMEAGVLEAIIKPDVAIDPIEIKVNLASDMDFLRQSVLDLDRIALQVRVENPTGISAQIGARLTPYDDNDKPLTANQVSQHKGLVIQPNTTSELWLSNSKTGMPEGYTFVENKTIAGLFRTLPTRVEAVLEVLPDDILSVIDLNNPQPTQLKIGYALVAPIALGKEFKLAYKERVKGLQNQLDDLLKYTRALELTVDAQNNIPLDLQLTAVALDASGSAIPVAIETQGTIAAGGKDGSYKQSTIVLALKEGEPNALNRLDQIDLFFVGSTAANETGAELQEHQAIKIKMSAKIPGGFNLNAKQ